MPGQKQPIPPPDRTIRKLRDRQSGKTHKDEEQNNGANGWLEARKGLTPPLRPRDRQVKY